jgi:hypothetical protein
MTVGIDSGPTASTIDHVVPLARGGAKGRSNQVLACQDCNSRRGHMLPSEWASSAQLPDGAERRAHVLERCAEWGYGAGHPPVRMGAPPRVDVPALARLLLPDGVARLIEAGLLPEDFRP